MLAKKSVRNKLGLKYILIIYSILYSVTHLSVLDSVGKLPENPISNFQGAGIILCGIFTSQNTWHTDYASLFWEVDAYLRLFMFKPIEFPGFLCKARFSRGGNSLFTSSGLHALKQSWTSVNLRVFFILCESVKVKMWKLKCESVKGWKWKCESGLLSGNLEPA